MPTKKRTSKTKSPERTGPPEHILKRLAGQRSLQERFRDPPGEELTRAQALGTWLNFFCDYAVYPEVHRGHYAAVHKAATDYLIHLADAHGIDGTALHHAGVICRQLAKKQELRDKTAGCLWPECLGEHRYTLPEAQQNAIEAGERVIQKVRLKLGFKAEEGGEAGDDSAWVRAATIWTKHQDQFTNGKAFKRYLVDHPEIGHRLKGQRLEVHAGGWQRHVDAEDKSRLEALEVSQEDADAAMQVIQKKRRQ